MEGRFVPTQHPTHTPNGIAVVGEAPGFQEATYQRPFMGPSGKLLNRVLVHAGIDRGATLLTNACLCRPPDNATPTPEAVAACKPRLHAELIEAGVDKVLALGNTAAKATVNTTKGILALRVGAPKQASFAEDVRVVATVHPAYCLRNGDGMPFLTNDVLKLEANPPEWEPPEYVVVDTVETALQAIEQLHVIAEKLTIDIECGIEKDISFSHPSEYEMLCIGVGYAKGKVVIIGENACVPEVYAPLRELFRAKRLSAHNGKFDLEGLHPVLGVLRLYFDTMLAHYCTDERPGTHRLDQLGTEILGTPDWKDVLKPHLGEGKNYAAIPREILYKYCAYDVAVTWDLEEYFTPRLERKGLRKLHDFLVEASNALMFPELNGIAVDRQYSAQLSNEYLHKIYAEYEVMQGLTNGKVYDGRKGNINPASPKQVKEFLFDNQIAVESTDKETLERILDRFDFERNRTEDVFVFIRHLLEHRYLAKRRGTFIEGIRKRTHKGRVFTNYLLHGTTSGRLASRNPNLQNIVRDEGIRRQFVVSRPDNVLIHGDYKQVEGRVIATEAKDEYLRNIFADPDRDLFDELGEGLYHKALLSKEERIRTKAYFYGLGYGRTAYTIAAEYKLPLHQVEADLVQFRSLIPGVVAWQQATTDLILSKQVLTTTFGRKRRFFLITKENRKDVLNEGLSFIPQSTASDICLRALTRIQPRLKGKGHIRLTIHDAIVAEAHESKQEEVQEIMREEMIRSAEEWTDYLPFEVDFSVGKNWGELG